MFDHDDAYEAYQDNLGDHGCDPFEDDLPDFEDDGQPDEYTEWQDFMGGDDWDHGQYEDMGDYGYNDEP